MWCGITKENWASLAFAPAASTKVIDIVCGAMNPILSTQNNNWFI